MSRVRTSSIDRAVVDDELHLLRVEVGQPEDVPAMPFHGLFPFPGWIFLEGHAPFLRSPLDADHDGLDREVGTFLPTKSARMGAPGAHGR